MFLTPKAFAAGSPILHWALKREVKAQVEDFATKIGIDKPAQKEIRKGWIKYQKEKRKNETREIQRNRKTGKRGNTTKERTKQEW